MDHARPYFKLRTGGNKPNSGNVNEDENRSQRRIEIKKKKKNRKSCERKAEGDIKRGG